MVWLLDPDGCEVLGGHPRDGGHVVAGVQEQLVVLLEVEVSQPSQQDFVVLERKASICRKNV